MAAAVIDLAQGDETTGHPVVNVIMADPAIDRAPDGFLLVAADGVDNRWKWSPTLGFIAPPPDPLPPPDDEASA